LGGRKASSSLRTGSVTFSIAAGRWIHRREEGVMLILRLNLDPVAAHGGSTRVRHSRTPERISYCHRGER